MSPSSARGPRSLARLLQTVYSDLRRLAAWHMRKESTGHTLQATALVHEAYLRLAGWDRLRWRDQSHFLAVASGVMRNVLVDHARRRCAHRRGGEVRRVPLDVNVACTRRKELAGLLDLDRALRRLETTHAELSQVVELLYFGGLTVDEAAQALGLSPRTVKRHWATARILLHRELTRTVTRDTGIQ